MKKPIQIFMEYRVNKGEVADYEAYMKNVLVELETSYEATDVHWYEAADQQNLYVEMFKVPSMDHYEKIKQARRDKDHPVFGRFADYVGGGMEKVHCWAFIQRT